jgi:hypothetical protein
VVVAVAAAASMWFYVDRILVGHQMADAVAHDNPRGNLSDLYPRWLGARELLLHHRNPYGDDVTVEIQEGYYGREIDASRPNDPKDRQGFAYPVYVVLLLAPMISLPFHDVQIFFHWLLVGVTAASIAWWLRVLRLRWPFPAIAIAVALMLGSVPAVQGIKLQQLSLLVAALLAAAAACVSSGWLFCGGALLALATIKPQLAGLPCAWLLVWTLGDWRARRRLAFGFAAIMALLLLGAEIVLPGWWGMFTAALSQYHRYTQNASVLDQLVPWGFAGKILAGIAVIASSVILWRLRKVAADSEKFGRATALVMALTVLVVPMYAPYNQVLLIPAILALLRECKYLNSRSRGFRFGYLAGAFALVWQWMASVTLCAIYLLASRSFALDGWKWPFFATFALPVLIFALMLVDTRNHKTGEEKTQDLYQGMASGIP